MPPHIRVWFKSKDIILDGEEYEDCTFVDCRLLYCGGEPPMLSANSFVRCTWELDGAALRTLGFFAVLNMIGMRELAEGWIAQVLGTRVLPEAPEKPIQ
jgi:hypothetical protein